MSRLDVFVARMVSQRASLNHAAEMIKGKAGPAFAVGLGQWAHLQPHVRNHVRARDLHFRARGRVPSRQHPPDDMLLLGDVHDTLPAALARFGPVAQLIHTDLGGHDLVKNDAFARKISPLVEPLLANGGLMVASDRMYFDTLVEIPLPPDASPEQWFIYQRS
ncbi:class I SAM-dependent methyltransferase [Sulfitobacter sp.]|uniref:class I SAM-dependent methyltransferase n=1 Tax=Sulfitobacter sp. TaxID=1903071 RepID=UPI0030018F9F